MNLDDELRQLFSDERLEVPARPGAEDVLVAGAQRVRRRRIAAVTASGALAVVAVVAAGFLLTGGHPDAMPPANHYKNTPTSTATTTTTSSSTQPSTTTQNNVTTGTLGGNADPPDTGTGNTEPTSTSVDPPPVLGYPVVGPSGFQALLLGQSEEDAKSTGMIGVQTAEVYGNCSEYQLLVDSVNVGLVYFSSSGLAAVMPWEAQTPEGVGIGWTLEQAAAVYPDLDAGSALANGFAVVSAPGNPDATYYLLVDSSLDTIARVTLQTAARPCF
jgi:hypothetical protein